MKRWGGEGILILILTDFSPTWLQFHVLRTYRRAACRKRKAQVNAKMSLVQRFMPHVDAGIEESKIEPPREPKSSPEGSKSSPEASMSAKMCPRGAQEHPRGAQDLPRCAQEVPKRCPIGAQGSPRCAQEVSKAFQNGAWELPKHKSWMVLSVYVKNLRL